MLLESATTSNGRSLRKASLAQRFRESASVVENLAMPTAQVRQWMADRRRAQGLEVTPTPLRDLHRWGFDPVTGNLGHDTGRFFTVQGIEVRTNFGTVHRWQQPIVNQTDVAILGILVKEFDGVLHFLMQAKAEPGNLGDIQLSPTIQATHSNYTRVHGGAAPPYLEYFLDEARGLTLVDQLQSELSSRFFRKRNRNVIVEAAGPVVVGEDFCWLTLGQIHELLWQDNVVNMDSRTVLSCVPFSDQTGTDQTEMPPGSWGRSGPGDSRSEAMAGSLVAPPASPDSDGEILNWICRLKNRYELQATFVPLRELADWQWSEETIHREDGLHFEVMGVSIKAGRREVASWAQPMLRATETGIVAFLARSRGGVLEFLVQGMVEAGNFDIVELGPTVQCQLGTYRGRPLDQRPAFLDTVLNASPSQVIYDAFQSEEGGRFYQEQHRHLVVHVPHDEDLTVPPNYRWLTARQLKALVRHNNQLNMQARSLLACFGAIVAGPRENGALGENS